MALTTQHPQRSLQLLEAKGCALGKPLEAVVCFDALKQGSCEEGDKNGLHKCHGGAISRDLDGQKSTHSVLSLIRLSQARSTAEAQWPGGGKNERCAKLQQAVNIEKVQFIEPKKGVVDEAEEMQ